MHVLLFINNDITEFNSEHSKITVTQKLIYDILTCIILPNLKRNIYYFVDNSL